MDDTAAERDGGKSTRRALLAGLGTVASGSVAGCSLSALGSSGDGTPTDAVSTRESLSVDFDDGSMAPLAVREEVGETPRVVDPVDVEGQVLELAADPDRSSAVRSSVAVSGEFTASVSARTKDVSITEARFAFRLLDRRSGAMAGVVQSGHLTKLVRSGPDGEQSSASGRVLDSYVSWWPLSLTVRRDELSTADGALATEPGFDLHDRPLVVTLAVEAVGDKIVIARFDDLAVDPL